MSYEIGQKVRVDLRVTDPDGVLTNATVAVATAKPNSTVGPVPTVINDGTGLYHFDVVPDAVPGPWLWTATVSGAVTAVQRGQFWVREPSVNLIALDEIKVHLNKTTNVDDDELRDWIDAARYAIEREVGPVIPRTVVDYYAGGRRRIVLRQGPVVSVTSVVETWGPGDARTVTAEPGGGPWTDDNYLLDTSNRSLVRRSNGWTGVWGPDVTVTYVAGRYPITMNVKMAVAELITHLWRGSQLAAGGTRPNATAPETIQLGYAIPNRVRELLGKRRAPRLGG